MVANSLGWALSWLVTVLAIGVIAFPLTHRLLPRLPSRGIALSPTLGLLLVAYLSWITASLHIVPFGRQSLIGAVGVLALLSIVSEVAARGASLRWLGRHIPIAFFFLGVTVTVFGFFLWVRGYYPDVRSTEKPMEIGFLTSTMRAHWMPPHDPWLSGYGINYYYFGYVEAAALGLLSGARPEVTFNLMSVTIPALTFAGTSGIGYDLWVRARREHGHSGVRPPRPFVALVSGALVVLAGNAYGFARLLTAPGMVLHATFWTGIGWNSSRVIEDHIVPGTATQMITEFPMFSFLLGDIHPHVLALPTVVLAIAVALGHWARPAGERGDALARYALTALVVGALYPINAWDFPTFGLFVGAAIALRRPLVWWQTGIKLGALAVASVVLYAPYYANFTSLVGGHGDEPAFIQELAHYPVLGQLISMFGFVTWPHTDLRQFLAVFGLPFAAAATLIIRGNLGANLLRQPQYRRSVPATLLVIAAIALITRTAMLLPTGLLIVFGALAVLRPIDHRPAGTPRWRCWTGTDRTVAAVAAYGALLPVIPEFVFLRDAFDNRMNTMFKVDYQAWMLLMVAGAYSIVTLVAALRDAGRAVPLPTWRRSRAAVYGLMTVLALFAMTYPVLVTYQRTGHFGNAPIDFGDAGAGWQGVDGFRYIATTNPDEYAAALWLRAHSAPSDRLIEAVGNSYGETEGWFQSRFAASTGTPGVLGWYFHEVQWRGGAPKVITNQLPERAVDIGTFYSTTNVSDARRILTKYDIQWVIVGSAEQDGEGRCGVPVGCPPYAQAGLAKFGDMLDLAYRHGRVSIYHVS